MAITFSPYARGVYASKYFSDRQNGYIRLNESRTSLLRRIASDLDQWCFIFGHVFEVAGEGRPRNSE